VADLQRSGDGGNAGQMGSRDGRARSPFVRRRVSCTREITRERANGRTDGRTDGRPVLSISLRTGRGSCITYGEAGMPVAAR